MRFDLHLRSTVRNQIERVVTEMKAWEEQPRIDSVEADRIRASIGAFSHTIERPEFTIVGVDGSGDFPLTSFADSFIYFSVALSTLYGVDSVSGLREIGPQPEPRFHFTWLPENERMRRQELDQAFASLAGMPIHDVIEQSDYRKLKSQVSGHHASEAHLIDELIRPHASDAGNLAIQLRSTAEFGSALQRIIGNPKPSYVLMDTTLSLPSVSLSTGSLFYEHLKRLCCTVSRDRGICFLAISKSHGLPSLDHLESLAKEALGTDPATPPEHWYLRIPVPEVDGWGLSLTEGMRLPPYGVVTYLVRFHRTTPTMRIDMDREFWFQRIHDPNPGQVIENEQHVFQDLDYASHDQRCYGYPYPIKAAHDRISLTKAERTALRKIVSDEAIKSGMKRALFQSASEATGHE